MTLPFVCEKELQEVPPEHFAAILRAAGWKRLDHDYFQAQQWVHLRSGIDVLLPNSMGLRDYTRLTADVLRALARTQNIRVDEVFRRVQLAGADVLRVRRPTDDPYNTMPLAAGRAVVDNTFKLMGAAAVTALDPRAVLPPRRPRQALDYMEKRVRLGHSERGSYVVTIVSDVTPLNTPGGMPGLLEFMEAPFPRLVTRTLQNALCAAQDTATAVACGADEALAPAVQLGVSAELLDAIAGILGGAPDGEGIGFEMNWAPIHPEPAGQPRGIWFLREHQEVFIEAARRIREIEPFEGIAVTGVVERLHREDGDASGVATIACIIDHAPRKLSVPLGPEEYDLAIGAHHHNQIVVFRADVERRGRRFVAERVRGFRVTDD